MTKTRWKYSSDRQVNFSIAANSTPPSADKITRELRRYSAGGCADVTARLRREAGVDSAVTDLLALYGQVIARHRSSTPDLRSEVLANARCLRKIFPLIRTAESVLEDTRPPETGAASFDELGARLELREEQIKYLVTAF